MSAVASREGPKASLTVMRRQAVASVARTRVRLPPRLRQRWASLMPSETRRSPSRRCPAARSAGSATSGNVPGRGFAQPLARSGPVPTPPRWPTGPWPRRPPRQTNVGRPPGERGLRAVAGDGVPRILLFDVEASGARLSSCWQSHAASTDRGPVLPNLGQAVPGCRRRWADRLRRMDEAGAQKRGNGMDHPMAWNGGWHGIAAV